MNTSEHLRVFEQEEEKTTTVINSSLEDQYRKEGWPHLGEEPNWTERKSFDEFFIYPMDVVRLKRLRERYIRRIDKIGTHFKSGKFARERDQLQKIVNEIGRYLERNKNEPNLKESISERSDSSAFIS